MDITCVICIDNFKYYDLILILDCGHQLHYSCAIRIKDKKHCCLCKKQIRNTAKVLWKEPMSFFNKRTLNFSSLRLHTTICASVINKKINQINSDYYKEIITSQKEAVSTFIDSQLNMFYTKILSAVNKNKSCIELGAYQYGFKINDIPLVFLLYGPKSEGLKYFKEHDFLSVTDYLKSKLGDEFNIHVFKKDSKNYIYAKWN